MPKLALHFTVPADVDPKAVAAALQQQLAEADGVDTAKVTADQQRTAIGPQEIIVILTAATAIMNSSVTAVEVSAKLMTALRKAVDAARDLAHSCGLGGGRLEAGMKQVPLDAVTDHDLHLASGTLVAAAAPQSSSESR